MLWPMPIKGSGISARFKLMRCNKSRGLSNHDAVRIISGLILPDKTRHSTGLTVVPQKLLIQHATLTLVSRIRSPDTPNSNTLAL